MCGLRNPTPARARCPRCRRTTAGCGQGPAGTGPVVARNVQHEYTAPRFENPVQVLAVVVRFKERMPLGEQDPLQRREGGIAEEQLPFGQPRRQVQILAVGVLRSLTPQFGRLAAFLADIQPLPVQPFDQIVQQRQHTLQRCRPCQPPPIRLAARHGGPIGQQRRKMIVRRDVAPRRTLAQECVLQETVPALLRQPVDLQKGDSASPVGSGPVSPGDRLPLLAVLRDQYLEHFGDPVAVLAAAVAGNHDPTYGCRLGQFDLHPLALARSSDPAKVVPVAAVVQMLDLVNRIPGKHRRSARHGTAFGQGEVVFARGAVDLQFVDPRLRIAAGLVNRHAHEPGLLGREVECIRRLYRLGRDLRQLLPKLVRHQPSRCVPGPTSGTAHGHQQANAHPSSDAWLHRRSPLSLVSHPGIRANSGSSPWRNS
jgi:hypothetical protein